MPTISAMISIILEGLINAILQNKSITGIKIDKEEINLYLDGMILYQKTPNDKTDSNNKRIQQGNRIQTHKTQNPLFTQMIDNL